MTRPIIGITCNRETSKDFVSLREVYLRKIQEAGGMPLLISHYCMDAIEERSLLANFDGFLLSGGGDVGAHAFGEEPLPGLGEVFPPRDDLEISITRKAMEQKVPLLGICRGMQVINVALGGTLYQDIHYQRNDNIQHYQKAPENFTSHYLEIAPNTLLDNLLADVYPERKIKVNSFHHQAVKEVPAECQVSAWSTDGIVEAIELPSSASNFFLGVQWHPETLEDQSSKIIFKAFVESCQKNS